MFHSSRAAALFGGKGGVEVRVLVFFGGGEGRVGGGGEMQRRKGGGGVLKGVHKHTKVG